MDQISCFCFLISTKHLLLDTRIIQMYLHRIWTDWLVRELNFVEHIVRMRFVPHLDVHCSVGSILARYSILTILIGHKQCRRSFLSRKHFSVRDT